jgi:hypothetical protein
MEPPLDATLERKQRNWFWAIAAANFAVVTAVHCPRNLAVPRVTARLGKSAVCAIQGFVGVVTRAARHRYRRAAFFKAGFATCLCRATDAGIAADARSTSSAGPGITGRTCPSSNARSWPSTELLTR